MPVPQKPGLHQPKPSGPIAGPFGGAMNAARGETVYRIANSCRAQDLDASQAAHHELQFPRRLGLFKSCPRRLQEGAGEFQEVSLSYDANKLSIIVHYGQTTQFSGEH